MNLQMNLQMNLLSISTVQRHFNVRQLKRCSWMLLVSAALSAYAQNSSEFSKLERHINREVTVETIQGQRITGNLARVEQSRLVIYEAGALKTVPGDAVKTVTAHKSRHTAAWVLGMSAAGLGVGLLAGLTQFDDATNANGKIAGTALGVAGVGAAAGFGISRIGKTEQVVYQSGSGKEARD